MVFPIATMTRSIKTYTINRTAIFILILACIGCAIFYQFMDQQSAKYLPFNLYLHGPTIVHRDNDSHVTSKPKDPLSLPPSFKNNKNDRERVIAAAKHIVRNGNILLVSFINNAYLPFAYSWLCNVQNMNLNKQLLVITTDDETEVAFRKSRPDIATVSVNDFLMKGNQIYTHAGYVRIGIKRTQILNWILQENIGIFLFEFDCLWVRNPVPELTKFTEYDLVITPVAQRPGMVAIGFYYMAPTDRMKNLWQELTRRLMVLDKRLQKLEPGAIISEGENDQLYLTALVKQKYANIRVKLLSLSEYPDGKWYNLPESKRNVSNIFILNNNWIRGNPAKIARAKKFGHWFLNDDGRCNDTQVIKIVRRNH